MRMKEEYWMRLSIEISKESANDTLKVGTVLVSQNDVLLCSAFSGEVDNKTWSEVLVDKIRTLNVSYAHGLFLTINTIHTANVFELQKILSYIEVENIYIGLPDPSLTDFIDNDPFLTKRQINRYPELCQKEILEINDSYYTNSRQNLRGCRYYYENRVGSLVVNNLKKYGYTIPFEILNTNRQRKKIAWWLCRSYNINYPKASKIINNAISDAFNQKYSVYNNADDLRSVYPNWEKPYIDIRNELVEDGCTAVEIINVGVGNGEEAMKLFTKESKITFVDVATDGLAKLKSHFPLANTLICNADDLSLVTDDVFDLYVSLRTFNSSFFNIKDAVVESYRVLKKGGAIILSIANGFLVREMSHPLKGLIIPSTDFVDIYRGVEMAKAIRKELISVGYVKVKVITGETEIFLFGIKE